MKRFIKSILSFFGFECPHCGSFNTGGDEYGEWCNNCGWESDDESFDGCCI